MKLFSMSFVVGVLLVGSTEGLAQLSDEQQVRQLVYKKFEWMRMLRIDSLTDMLDENLMYIHSNGWVETREDVINNLKNGKLVYRQVTINEATVRLYPNTAIVTGKGAFSGMNSGTEFSLNLLFTEVYVKKINRWLLASRHASRLP
jgi:hypothetical protein